MFALLTTDEPESTPFEQSPPQEAEHRIKIDGPNRYGRRISDSKGNLKAAAKIHDRHYPWTD
jgi:hypothetical protein